MGQQHIIAMGDNRSNNRGVPPSAVYGLGFIGALIYFITTATSFWMGVLGFFKAVVWPVILVYEALKHFGA